MRRSEEELHEVTRMVAHDLHSALRTVSVHAALLGETDETRLDPGIAQRIAYVADGVRQLDALAEGLANYSNILNSNRETSPAVAMETVLRLALARLEAAIRQTQATVTHGPLPKIPGNIDLLTRLLENLIANGLRYYGPEAPKIHISAEKRDDNWAFLVRDNGDGIDPVYRQAVFAPFKRLHGREQSGTGLGLTICRRITDLHGGSIWVESNPEGGSTFVVTLPANDGTLRES
ncbi:MAG: sensor histidine kinase [Bryobacteraceae bacterium]